MNRFAKLLNKATDNTIQPGDETAEASNVRNMLANSVNPLLEEYVNPVLPEKLQMAIPKMTVAEDKQFYQNLPEQMAGATMGSLNVVPSARFGNILNVAGKEVAKDLGKVTVKPSMADLADDAAKIGGKKLKANEILEQFEQKYGQEAAKRKSDVKQGLKTPDEYGSWKQEMMNKLRGL